MLMDVPAGPCGPCSELYYDLHPERGLAPEVTLEDDSRWVAGLVLIGQNGRHRPIRLALYPALVD